MGAKKLKNTVISAPIALTGFAGRSTDTAPNGFAKDRREPKRNK
jgi:hypothetical protein